MNPGLVPTGSRPRSAREVEGGNGAAWRDDDREEDEAGVLVGGKESSGFDGSVGMRRRKKSPYAQQSSDYDHDLPDASYADHPNYELDEEEDEDDNLPLGIAMRRVLSRQTSSVNPSSTPSSQPTSEPPTIPRLSPDEIRPPASRIRLRRGSEGYEIRPVVPSPHPRQSYKDQGEGVEQSYGEQGEGGEEVGGLGGEEWAPEGFYDSASNSSNDAFDPSTRHWSSDIPRRSPADKTSDDRNEAGAGEENEGMEVDSEGDMVRRGDFGGRYRRYEREVDSEEEGSEDSMEKYLKD